MLGRWMIKLDPQKPENETAIANLEEGEPEYHGDVSEWNVTRATQDVCIGLS